MRAGRGPLSVQGRDDRGRPGGARAAAWRATLDEAESASPQELGYPLLDPAIASRWAAAAPALRPHAEESATEAAQGLARTPGARACWSRNRVIGWKEYELEVMRDRRRQLRGRLLHREPRPDGRPHRRQHHRRPGADADRQGVPAPARPWRALVMHAVGVETGGRNVQFAVNPRDRPRGGHRDEPARLAARRRWPPRPPASPSPRSPRWWPSATRWTRSPTTSRAAHRAAFEPSHRLRGGQDPALGLREVPRRRSRRSARR